MKILNYIKYTLFASLPLFALSCGTEEQYKPSPVAEGAQVYFPEGITTSFSIGEEETSVTIPVKRYVADGALTVDLLVDLGEMPEAAQDYFTVPTSVTFNSGETDASVVIPFDRSKLTDGEEYTIGLLLNDEANTTPYGYSSVYVTISPWPWEYLGVGKYRDDVISGLYGATNAEVDCKIYRNKSREGVYMLEDLFSYNLLSAIFGASASALSGQFPYTPTNITINCADPNRVIIPQQFTGVSETSEGLGRFSIGTLQPGTLVDGVITFPTRGLLISGDGSEDYAWYANNSGLFRIVLPGVELVDYSLGVSYAGMRVAADNETATAVFDFSYGADVTGISYAFVDGDATASVAEIAKAIVDGTVENVYDVDDFVAGAETVSVEAEIKSGSYTIVALPYDVNGRLNVDNAAAAWFYFPGMGGGASECEFEVNTYKVSEYPAAAAYVGQYPDYSSFVYELTGKDIKSAKMYVNRTAVVETAPSSGLTYEALVSEYGKALPDKAIAEINAGEPSWDICINLAAETSYTVLVLVQNDFGKSALVRADVTTSPIPYSGDLVIGDYTMTCTVPQSSGDPFTSRTVLKVSPTIGSNVKFVVKNLLEDDDLGWFATYDSAAKTLTLDGTSPDFSNQAQNYFGSWLGLTSQLAAAYFSYDDPEGAANLPVVFTVNDSKRLEGLARNLQVDVGQLSGNNVTPLGTAALYLAGETSIVFGASETASLSGASVLARLSSPYMFETGSVMKANRLSSQVEVLGRPAAESPRVARTLDVRTSVCEPLPHYGPYKVNGQRLF